jgi:hypothetical protein
MKLGVCVPYRNREMHLNEFVPKVGKYLKDQGIDFCMYFAHQVDDKLFNRGATKNIAAKHAFEDGCDYIVWHDIDMIPEENGGADYSFPSKGPRHIATQISQMDYQLKYHEYFGGAVLFSKEDVLATNGYSNDYWDWGMEDDDLFWRCQLEGLTNQTYIDTELSNQKYKRLDGNKSFIKIPFQRELRSLNSRSHTLSVLLRARQQPDKNPIFLIGSNKRKYVEYPVVRVKGYDYGIGFNNSRTVSLTYWNTFHQHNYMWVKRYDEQWTWVTAVFDTLERKTHFYLNGSEVDSRGGYGTHSPLTFTGRLKNYGSEDWYIGTSPSEPDDSTIKYFKGDIAKVFAWKRPLSQKEVASLHSTVPQDDLAIDLDFNNPTTHFNEYGTENRIEDILVPNSILPHRVEGKFRCLPHEDEGIINGKFAKGETTARNERRYVLQMQQEQINYKEDGIKQVKYELVGEEQLTPWAKMLNIKL